MKNIEQSGGNWRVEIWEKPGLLGKFRLPVIDNLIAEAFGKQLPTPKEYVGLSRQEAYRIAKEFQHRVGNGSSAIPAFEITKT